MTWSHTVPYKKSQFIICQKAGEQLHKVETKETGQNMLDVLVIKFDLTVYLGDTLANDVLYHNLLRYSKKEILGAKENCIQH